MSEPDVIAIHLARRVAALDNGEEIPISKMFDCFGEETNDPDEALGLSMGPDSRGHWYAAPVSAFDGEPH